MSGNAALEGAAPGTGPPPPPSEGTFPIQQQQQQTQQQPPQVQQQPHQQPQTQQPPPPPPAPEVDAEFMAVLAKTQNACLAEMGYYPTLLQEHLELKKQFALLRGDNQKLYSDNYNLAQCVQAQEQRLKQQQGEQGKRPRDDLEERVRRLTAERDELTGRLHSALNEVMILRQELSRFAPTAIMMPAHGYPPPPPQQQQQQQQVVHHRMIPVPGPPAMVHVQQHPSNFIQYGGPPPPPHPGQHQNHRQIQPLPTHRQSHPALSPIDTSSTPTIAAHRRTSAPVVMTAQQHGAGPGPMSPSALSQFNGLTLASPAVPGSRPSTAGAPSTAPPQAYIPRPASGPPRAIPPQPRRTSTNPLNGAVIDLTEDEAKMQDGARKRRKTDHGPEMAGPPAPPPPTGQVAMPITPVSPAFAPSAGQHVSQTLRAPPPSQLPPPLPSASAPPGNPQPVPATPQLSSSVSEPAVKPPPPNPPPENEDVNMDEQTTLEEDCLDANFDEDEADPDKLWCKMCRSRYKAGHTTEVPQPFIGIMPEELAAHCASVHPQGWEVLKRRIADLRAKEAAREA
ncbi:hypothetical protein C2E23DRAFT_887111 [Lenzites betulinus]|nr:hypothetical protein C2E23DRAFT_887111 [Lenzites betulinus]